MENDKMNRAERHFVNALLSLMKTKRYQDITVKELSDKAEYDRRTYYRHFSDKEDIINLYCSHLLNEMAIMMKTETALSVQGGILAYFTFWEKHKEFLALLEKNNLLHFLSDRHDNLIYYYVGKSVQPDIPENLDAAPPLSRYSFYFTSGGLWNSLVHWVKEEPHRTPEELTQYILQTFKGMSLFMDTQSQSW